MGLWSTINHHPNPQQQPLSFINFPRVLRVHFCSYQTTDPGVQLKQTETIYLLPSSFLSIPAFFSTFKLSFLPCGLFVLKKPSFASAKVTDRPRRSSRHLHPCKPFYFILHLLYYFCLQNPPRKVFFECFQLEIENSNQQHIPTQFLACFYYTTNILPIFFHHFSNNFTCRKFCSWLSGAEAKKTGNSILPHLSMEKAGLRFAVHLC